jgi:hypothetical protein
MLLTATIVAVLLATIVVGAYASPPRHVSQDRHRDYDMRKR